MGDGKPSDTTGIRAIKLGSKLLVVKGRVPDHSKFDPYRKELPEEDAHAIAEVVMRNHGRRVLPPKKTN